MGKMICFFLLLLSAFCAVAGGLYLGLWQWFVLPIIDIINAAKEPTMSNTRVALDLFCIFVLSPLACTAGIWTGLVSFIGAFAVVGCD